MIFSYKKLMAVLGFIVIYFGMIFSFFMNDFFLEIQSHNEILEFIISGQKLTFNLNICLSILFWGFSNKYLNVMVISRFNSTDKIYDYILKKGLLISGFVYMNSIIIQIIAYIIFGFKFEIYKAITSSIIIFIFSFSSFTFYNMLYMKKIKNSLSIIIVFISRIALYMTISGVAFVDLQKNININLVIYIYIIIELIICNLIQNKQIEYMENLIL